MAHEADFPADISTEGVESDLALRRSIYGVIDFLHSPSTPIVSPPRAAQTPKAKPCLVLDGVVAFVDVRSDADNRSEAIERQLLRLGASTVPKLSHEVTHVVYKDGRKLTLEKAKRWNLHLVSVLWVDSCKQTQERVPESLFPINSVAQDSSTPLLTPKLKKTKSMQPKDFDVDLANSTERAEKRRKRISLATKKNDNQTPTTSKLAFFVAETQDLSPDLPRSTSNITIPDTPPSMKDLVRRLKNRHLEGSEETEEEDSQSLMTTVVKVAPLQRKLMDNDLGEVTSSPESSTCSSQDRLSGAIAPPAVGDTPTKFTSSLPANEDSPGGAHEHRLYLDVSDSPPSPDNSIPAFNLVGHLDKIAEEKQQSSRKEKVSLTPKDGRKTPRQNSAKKTEQMKETPKSGDAGNNNNSGRRKSGRRSAPPSNQKSPDKATENEVIKPKSAPSAPDRENVSTDAGKRRRSARLTCIPNLTSMEENETPKRRSRRMSKMPNVSPLSEETTDVLDMVDQEGSRASETSGASSPAPKKSSISEDSPSLQDRLQAKVAPKRTSRRSSSILASDLQNKDQTTSTKELTKQDKTPTNKSSKIDAPRRKSTNVKDPITSKPVASKEISSKSRDLTPITEKRKSPRGKGDYLTQKKSQIVASTSEKSRDGNNNNSFKKPAIKPLNGTSSKKVRQSIEEFSTRSYNVSLSKKISSQLSPLNIRKRNHTARDMSMSCVASQLESTASKGGRQKKGYPSSTSRSNKTSCTISQGKFDQTQSIQSLVMTSLHYDEQDVVESVVKKLGQFRLRDTVCSHTTHVICGKNRRTLNVLHAIAQGCWLLSYEWVLQSLENGRWVDEAPYELSYFPAAKRSRLMHKERRDNCDIFGSCGSIFVSEKSVPPKSHIVKLVTKCSGQVTSDSEDADIAVGTVPHYHRANVTEQWVLDSVSSLECAEVKDYQISHRVLARSQSPQF